MSLTKVWFWFELWNYYPHFWSSYHCDLFLKDELPIEIANLLKNSSNEFIQQLISKKVRNLLSSHTGSRGKNQVTLLTDFKVCTLLCYILVLNFESNHRGPSPRPQLRAWATQLRRTVASVTTLSDLTCPGIERQISRIDRDMLDNCATSKIQIS